MIGARRAAGARRSPTRHDHFYVVDERTRSILTFMAYLNDGFEGGTTEFVDLKQTIVPKAGDALFFQHMLNHAGHRVTRGTKYVLRSDVLYRE